MHRSNQEDQRNRVGFATKPRVAKAFRDIGHFAYKSSSGTDLQRFATRDIPIYGVACRESASWQQLCDHVEQRTGYLPKAWRRVAALGGGWRITTAEKLAFVIEDLELAVDTSARFAEYTLAVLVHWNTRYPCPDLRSVAYVVTDSVLVPAHCRTATANVENPDWWRLYVCNLLQVDSDPTGEGFAELLHRARTDLRYRFLLPELERELRRRREFATLVGIVYSDNLWYKPLDS